ncbi:TPR repeat protein [Crossiella equi]|uniref:TPR repeat protein n=1 Tax=Crossiella equi TaxID=130796 RepID=A0ABS5AI22_9PSEU|nr:tetratricopeptide repeat protein [Crossiella equi]MBP2476218.1 TPR repeat protein [Crossiella equi]
MSWLEERLGRAERDGATAVQWNELGMALADQRRWPQAEQCFRRAVEGGGDSANYNLGNVLRERYLLSRDRELLGEAVRCFRRAVVAGCLEAHQALGMALVELGEHGEEAREQLGIAVELGDHWAVMGQAQLADSDGDPAEQERLLRGLLDHENPVLADCARAELGIVLRFSGRVEAAEDVLTEGADRGQRHAAYQLALLLEDDLLDPVRAEPAYQRAIELGEQQAVLRLGRLLRRDRRPADALLLLRDAVEGGLVRAHAQLAHVYRDLNRHQEMFAVLDLGMALGDAETFFEAAEIAELDERREDQERILWRALAELPGAGEVAMARVRLADVFLTTGREAKGVELLRAGIAAGESDAANALGNYYSHQVGDTAAAEEVYRLAIASGDHLARYNLAQLFWSAGRLAEAESELLDLVTAGEASAYRDLAELAAEQGRTEDAERYRTRIPRGRR